jgi:hypothetical protein
LCAGRSARIGLLRVLGPVDPGGDDAIADPHAVGSVSDGDERDCGVRVGALDKGDGTRAARVVEWPNVEAALGVQDERAVRGFHGHSVEYKRSGGNQLEGEGSRKRQRLQGRNHTYSGKGVHYRITPPGGPVYRVTLPEGQPSEVVRVVHDTVLDHYNKMVHPTCFPDSMDPRGPKGR